MSEVSFQFGSCPFCFRFLHHIIVLYFNILACTKGFEGSVLTNSSSGIQHLWYFWYALVFVLKCYAETWLLRASPLNWALVRDWHRRSKVSVFIDFFSKFYT